MKAATSDQIAYFANLNEFVVAELYTITLTNGVVVRLTSWDNDIVLGGLDFSSAGPYVNRSRVTLSNTLDTDEVVIDVMSDIAHVVMGMPFLQAVAQGWFRKASVLVQRLYINAPTPFALTWFVGDVSTTATTNLASSITVVSDLYRLDAMIPKAVMQPQCRNKLYDVGCTVNKAAYAHTKTISAALALTITPTSLTEGDGFFDRGMLSFTSGANNGLTRTIKQNLGGVMLLNVPFPFAVNPGDTFNAYPGCDQTTSTCTSKFSNLVNFAGEPYVPAPETTL